MISVKPVPVRLIAAFVAKHVDLPPALEEPELVYAGTAVAIAAELFTLFSYIKESEINTAVDGDVSLWTPIEYLLSIPTKLLGFGTESQVLFSAFAVFGWYDQYALPAAKAAF